MVQYEGGSFFIIYKYQLSFGFVVDADIRKGNA
jgi:hypothetical protein